MDLTLPTIVAGLLQTYAAPITAVVYALPCFGMGLRLLHVWRKPLEVENGRWVQLGTGVILIEIILLLTGLVLTVETEMSPVKTLFVMLILGFFALVITASFRSRMLLVSFLEVIGGRLVATLLGMTDDSSKLLESYYVLAFMIYMSSVAASIYLPFPRWGISQELAVRFRVPGARGIWVEDPHRAIGAGAIYFLLLGVATLWVIEL
jgi:hypothetical protein